MVLPFIITSALKMYGAKKAYDGYKKKTKAERIVRHAQIDYEEAESRLKTTSNKVKRRLRKLAKLQSQIATDFTEFELIAENLLSQLPKDFSYSNTHILNAQSKLNTVVIQSTRPGHAKTAAIAGGVWILGGFIAGWGYDKHAEKALKKAHAIVDEIDEAIAKINKLESKFNKTDIYVQHVWKQTKKIYDLFQHYFQTLKDMNTYLKTGGDAYAKEDEVILVIGNGYQVAAILTDIITTSLFKPKTNKAGEIVLNTNNEIEMKLDRDGLQILNSKKLDAVLLKADQNVREYTA